MDSVFAKSLLLSLLVEIAEAEREVEVIRQTISESASSNTPENLFLLLANPSTYTIELEDLQKVLRDKDIKFSPESLRALFRDMDANRDSKVDLKEFLAFIQPREVTFGQQKSASSISIKLDAKLCLAKLIERELTLVEKVDALYGQNTHQGASFSVTDTFGLLDADKKGYATAADLFQFAKKEVATFTMTKAERSFRRISGGKQKLQVEEWRKYLCSKSTQKRDWNANDDTLSSSNVVDPRKDLSHMHSTRQSTVLKKPDQPVVLEEVSPSKRDFSANFSMRFDGLDGWDGPKVERILLDDYSQRPTEMKKSEVKSRYRDSSTIESQRYPNYTYRYEAALDKTNLKERITKEDEYLCETKLGNKLLRQHYERRTESIKLPEYARPSYSLSSSKHDRDYSYLKDYIPRRNLTESEFESTYFKNMSERKPTEHIKSQLLMLHPKPIIEYFKRMFEIAREIEDKRIDLAMRNDFCLVDLFSMVDTSHSTCISLRNMTNFLSDLFRGYDQTRLKSEDIRVFFEYYDKDHDRHLNFDEFSNLIRPVEADCKAMLYKRKAVGMKRLVEFNSSTLLALRKLFSSIIAGESDLDYLKKRIDNQEVIEFFRKLDQANQGKASPSVLCQLFLELGLNVSFKDILLCVDRFDLNFDGKISFKEYLREMSPQTHRYTVRC